MASFDTFTWQALTVVLTLLGLAGTVAFWRLRGPVAGLRMLAVALLPAAAYLTGTLRLLWEVGAAVEDALKTGQSSNPLVPTRSRHPERSEGPQ